MSLESGNKYGFHIEIFSAQKLSPKAGYNFLERMLDFKARNKMLSRCYYGVIVNATEQTGHENQMTCDH